MEPDAIILAGGKGTRLRPMRDPKALLVVKGKTLIDRKIEFLQPYVDKIIIACEYKAGQIVKYLKKSCYKDRIIISNNGECLGTAGALKKALMNTNKKEVIVSNVDDINDVYIEKLIEFGTNTICVSNPSLQFGVANINFWGRGTFEEKPTLKNIWVNCGIYYFNTNIKKFLPKKGSLETDFFPFYNFKYFKHNGMWKTFNTLNDVEEFENDKK